MKQNKVLIKGIIAGLICCFSLAFLNHFFGQDGVPESSDEAANVEEILMEKTAQPYDIVVINVHGTIDGEEIGNNNADGIVAMIGAGQMLPGMEESMVGKKIGEPYVVDITFPDDYDDENLSGKTMNYEIEILEIWRNIKTDLGETYYADMAAQYKEYLDFMNEE